MILQCFTNPDPQETKMLEKFPKHNLLHLNFLKLILWEYKEKRPLDTMVNRREKNRKSKFLQDSTEKTVRYKEMYEQQNKKEYNSERLPL